MKVIEVENLTKEYSLGSIGHGTLSKDLQSLWAKWRGKEDPNSKIGKSELNNENRFLALDNISFSVEKGDRLGIIGKNGAGKSTLLKILSRVITPTKGKVKIKGRMASLLEVGTGFHPELSGRDNIYLNGAILGMSRIEISSKFDEIVEFSDLSKFIDTPVKRYSSGMYVRLAFAVAAHLDPEILVIDEVLAVGDYTFQKKCLGKMEDLNEKEGRTIIFVSHDMNVINKLCSKIFLIEKGRVSITSDNVKNVTDSYINQMYQKNSYSWMSENPLEDNSISIYKFFISDDSGKIINEPLDNTMNYFITIELEIKEESELLQVGYKLLTQDGILLLLRLNTDEITDFQILLKKGKYILKNKLPLKTLNEGSYIISLLCLLHYKRYIFDIEEKYLNIYFDIKGINYKTPYQIQKRYGILQSLDKWNTEKIN